MTPVLAGAGRIVSVTFLPVWSPTPVACTIRFNVRCLIIILSRNIIRPTNYYTYNWQDSLAQKAEMPIFLTINQPVFLRKQGYLNNLALC